KVGEHYVIRLEKGEKVIEKLTEFCKKTGTKSGHFAGIGGLSEAKIGHLSIEKKKYHSKVFKDSLLELISLQGNVTMSEGEVKIHAHILIGDSKFRTFGGHLMEAKVLPTCEIVLFPFSETINRKHNERIGLQLLDF
ncbi:MAG: DNA-binding protein, partial [Candidatus Aenigmarchaeota archaeon]|nr:DNA-binding protein [Candidatus Aenigmarchaeota archaeon]